MKQKIKFFLKFDNTKFETFVKSTAFISFFFTFDLCPEAFRTYKPYKHYVISKKTKIIRIMIYFKSNSRYFKKLGEPIFSSTGINFVSRKVCEVFGMNVR